MDEIGAHYTEWSKPETYIRIKNKFIYKGFYKSLIHSQDTSTKKNINNYGSLVK